MSEKAIVLLSGGLDSSTVLAVAIRDGHDVHALSFCYGQKHTFELQAAQRIAQHFGVRQHRIIDLPSDVFTDSALVGDKAVPHGEEPLAHLVIPVTYVPARNTIFLSYALAWAEHLEAPHIYIGVSSVDYSGYPDCRPEFVEAFEKLANKATKLAVEKHVPIRIHAPLLYLDKKSTIQLGLSLGVDYSMTHTCYDPSPEGFACGECDACTLRRRGFAAAGVLDPTRYVQH